MSTFKRVLAWILIVISILGALVCAVGIVGSWAVSGSLKDGIEQRLTNVQATLSSVEGSLTNAGTQLQTANEAVITIRDAASQLSDNTGQNSPLLDRITAAIQEKLRPTIDKLISIIQPVWQTILSVNDTIETLNTVPGINLPTLTPQIQALNDQIQNINNAVQQLQQNVADLKKGVVQDILTPFLARIDTIAGYLTTLQNSINTYIEKIHNLQAAVTTLQAKIPGMITTAAVILTLILLWSILGQVSLILVAGFFLRTGRMIWKANLPKADEHELEPGV